MKLSHYLISLTDTDGKSPEPKISGASRENSFATSSETSEWTRGLFLSHAWLKTNHQTAKNGFRQRITPNWIKKKKVITPLLQAEVFVCSEQRFQLYGYKKVKKM